MTTEDSLEFRLDRLVPAAEALGPSPTRACERSYECLRTIIDSPTMTVAGPPALPPPPRQNPRGQRSPGELQGVLDQLLDIGPEPDHEPARAAQPRRRQASAHAAASELSPLLAAVAGALFASHVWCLVALAGRARGWW